MPSRLAAATSSRLARLENTDAKLAVFCSNQVTSLVCATYTPAIRIQLVSSSPVWYENVPNTLGFSYAEVPSGEKAGHCPMSWVKATPPAPTAPPPSSVPVV